MSEKAVQENGGYIHPSGPYKMKFGPGTQPLYVNGHPGMSLRDGIARDVLAMVLAQCTTDVDPYVAAKRAYTFADAMLCERVK